MNIAGIGIEMLLNKPLLLTSHIFIWSINTMYNDLFCSLHFSYSNRIENMMCIVNILFLNSH